MKRNYVITLLSLFFSVAALAQEQWHVVPNIDPNMAIRQINILPDGELWLGTYSNGAKKLVNSNWTTYTQGGTDVREISKDADGNYWMATWTGLKKFNPTTNTWQALPAPFNDIQQSVEIDDEGRIWVGTDGGADPEDGLYLYNTGEFFHSGNSPLGSDWVTNLETDKEGNIWACGKSIVKIEGTTMTGITMQSIGCPFNAAATAIGFNSANHIWVAVYDGGLGYFDGVSWTLYTAANSGLPENKLWSLVVDNNDNVWIGTENSGLVKFDGVNWTVYNTANSPITDNRIDALNCDAMNNIWIAPTYGGLLVYNQDGVASVKGKMFYDMNSDNIRQVDEPPVKNGIIALDPAGYHGITDNEGNYKVNILEAGSYTVTAHPSHDYVTDIVPASIPVNVTPTFTPVTQDFAVHLLPGIQDISVTGTSVTAARPGFSLRYIIRATNSGTLPAQNVSVQCTYDNILTFASASDSPAIAGNTLSWTIDNLDIGESKSIEVLLMVPANVNLLGTILQSTVAATVTGDINEINSNRVITQTIVGSYDPNDKAVAPKGETANGNIPLETELLDYTVRFQNTGTYEAWRVIITDEISPLLDLNSLRMVAASHDYSVNIDADGKVSWTFNNINLPYAAADEPGSHGFVRFTIKPKAGTDYGDQITNLANIFFDYNPPIITNETVNTFFDFSLSVGESDANRMTVYPNPAGDFIVIKNANISSGLHYTVVNAIGQHLLSGQLAGETTTVNLSGLSAGMYFIQLGGDRNQSFKVIKK